MATVSRRRLACIPLAAGLLAGCASTPSAEVARDRDPARPIWVPVATPRPLPPLDFASGTPRTVDIRGCVPGDIAAVEIVGVDGAPAIRLVAKGATTLEVSAPEGTVGQGVANLRVTTGDGRTHAVGFPVLARDKARTEVTYCADARSRPGSVSIAGRFNGWSPTATPLRDPDGDGVWTAEIAAEPGQWPYKFVVDGNWILDPANPDTVDDGGTANSRLVVPARASKALPPLEISVLSANMPGVGRQGGFKVSLADGARLVPAAVRVFVDNVALPPDGFVVDAEAGTVGLDVPADRLAAQQFVCVAAADSAGRSGSALAPFDFAASPRSPKDETIYYVVLDRFANGDPGNDDPVDDPEVVPLNDYAGGDIAGLRRAIADGYFEDLGVTTLWISPPYDQPDVACRDSKPPHRKLTGYHGYWPVDMRGVEPRWGSVDEFAAMVDEAHRRGLAVIVDFVSNHVHESNPIVAEHPDWFSRLELPDGTQNIRQYDAHPFSTWFDTFLPNIDYAGSPEATRYMADTAVWWIERTGADGFRHDAVKHVENVFWERCTAELRERIVRPQGKRLYQVGETVSSRATINQFIGPDLLDGQFDFPLFWTIEDVLAWERADMQALAKSLGESVDQYPPDAIMSPFLGNHDVPRFMGKAEHDNKPGKKAEAEEDAFVNPARVDDPLSYDKLRLAFAFLLSIPGAPMLYYGDEIGMTGSGRPDSRRMMIPADEWNGANRATYAATRAFLHARNASIALRRGSYRLLHADAETLAFARIAPEEVAVVVLQRRPGTGGGTLSVELPAEWGTPAAVDTLALCGLADSDAALRGRTLEVAARNYSSGIWRMTW